jgi:hypothetical protein
MFAGGHGVIEGEKTLLDLQGWAEAWIESQEAQEAYGTDSFYNGARFWYKEDIAKVENNVKAKEVRVNEENKN